jgi:hypothetical protein
MTPKGVRYIEAIRAALDAAGRWPHLTSMTFVSPFLLDKWRVASFPYRSQNPLLLLSASQLVSTCYLVDT